MASPDICLGYRQTVFPWITGPVQSHRASLLSAACDGISPGGKDRRNVDRIASALRGVAVCNVNILAPDTPAAQSAAKRLLEIFGSVGFPGQIVSSPTVPVTASLELQSNCENAAAALALQTALHDGGFRAPLLIDDRVPVEAILICLGRQGLF